MSKFSSYVQRADQTAKSAFEEIVEAEDKLRRAEAAVKAYPQRSSGRTTAEYEAKSARAYADLLAAREQLREVQSRKADYIRALDSIRQELSGALQNEFSADPAALDSNTLELLRSGILRSGEYSKLMQQFQAAGNLTMSRIISRYASSAADEREKMYGKGDQQVMELRAVGCQCDDDADAVAAKLGQFDVLREAFQRSLDNTSMIGNWVMLTADIIENF